MNMTQKSKFAKDIYGRTVALPSYGDKFLIDGYEFSVIEIDLHNDDICIIAGITLSGMSGTTFVGYYEYINQKKPLKLIDVYGIKMSTLEEMEFSKYIANNKIAMNTKTADERLAIVLSWQDIYFKLTAIDGTIKIRNTEYTINQLESFISNAVIKEVENYRLDPNCNADLWMSDPLLELTENEKVAFIYIINHKPA